MMDYDQVPQQQHCSRPEQPLIQHRDLNDNYNDNQHIQFQQHHHQQQQHLPPQHHQQQAHGLANGSAHGLAQPVVDHQQQQSWKSWSNGIQQQQNHHQHHQQQQQHHHQQQQSQQSWKSWSNGMLNGVLPTHHHHSSVQHQNLMNNHYNTYPNPMDHNSYHVSTN